jgi:ferritin-like metal-binding protein YciE
MKTTSKSSTNSKSQSKSSTEKGSKTAQGLRDLFEDQLKDIFWAEKALTKAIPRMIKNATSDELINALEDHLEKTKMHVERCEQVFEILGKPARAKKCPAMEGLITEAEEMMEDTEDGVVRDAGIIAAAQKIEHYEIASYGTLCAFAKTTGETEIADLLQQTLNEEKEADEILTRIAEASINEEAHEEQDA